MEQLVQNLKDGDMRLLEVPYPLLGPKSVLVRNHFSVISAGTESKTVRDARHGYLKKAQSRKEEVKKVIDAAKKHGVVDTYKMVMNKLEAPASLGYSCAGEVIGVGEGITDFKVGDWVACGGNSAVHAEVVAVPRNLVARVDESVPMRHAAFTTLGAIALQGVRQADLRLGECCAVIGLGILGQLTLQLLAVSGIKTVGIDLEKEKVKLAKKNGADLAFARNEENLEQAIASVTQGHGVDAVIITAGGKSHDPIDLAGKLCRKKGSVIIVGDVPTGFSRKHFFRKELAVKMSCSYGPGRYDAQYEEKGIDYPFGYVRWTENRNMQAFTDLLKDNKLNLDNLISHVFPLNQARTAYELILNKEKPFLGILLEYNTKKELQSAPKLPVERDHQANKNPKVAFVGAGNFAENFLLPALKGEVALDGVVTNRPNNAKKIADKFGFAFCSGNPEDVFHSNANTIFVATRHNSHANYVLQALRSKKNVFVEKPLCLNESELNEIVSQYAVSGDQHLMVGYNRRFSPLVSRLMEVFADKSPLVINYRINAGKLKPDHWVLDPEIGGGRVIGEVCHFVDLVAFIAQSPIRSVSARSAGTTDNLETYQIALDFENGSIATIGYFSNGSSVLGKEWLEVFGAGKVVQLDDFKELSIYGKKKTTEKWSKQDKGYKSEVLTFLDAIKKGKQTPISFQELVQTSLATFKVLESAKMGGQRIEINVL